MTALSVLIFSICLVIGSLVVIGLANRKEANARFLRKKLNQLKQWVESLEDVVLELDEIYQQREVVKIINEEIIERYEAMIELDPMASYLTAGLNNAKGRREEFSSGDKRRVSRMCDSDVQIARRQACVSEAGRILRRRHSTGMLSAVELKEYLLDLSWLHLQLDVISSVIQGHKALHRADNLTATAFYKKAQIALVKSSHPSELRQRFLREIGAILHGSRVAISEDLMPETEFNPIAEIDDNISEHIDKHDSEDDVEAAS